MGRRRTRARAHTAATLLVVVLLAACSSGGGGSVRATVGKRAPTFAAPRLVGTGEVRLTDFRGKPVLVNFFASWCTPCREELPLLQRVQDGKQAEVIAVLFDDSPSSARSFLGELGVTITTANDDGSIARAYRVAQKPGLPVTYAVSSRGVLVARHLGQLRPEDAEALVAQAR